MTTLARLRMFAATCLQAAKELVDPVPQPADPDPASLLFAAPYLGAPARMRDAHPHVYDPGAYVPGGLYGRGSDAPAIPLRREYLPVTSEGSLCEKCQAGMIASNSGTRVVPIKIKPGQRARIVARPQVTAFRPEQIEIENAEHWLVHDIKVGNRSQFSQSGDIPGEMFAPGVQGGAVSLETVQTAMDLVFEVTYTGPELDGEQFRARVTGAVCN